MNMLIDDILNRPTATQLAVKADKTSRCSSFVSLHLKHVNYFKTKQVIGAKQMRSGITCFSVGVEDTYISTTHNYT